MFFLLALLLFISPQQAGGEKLRVHITIAPEIKAAVPGIDAIEAGLASLFSREFGRFAELSFGGPAQSTDAVAEDAAAEIRIGGQDRMTAVSSVLTRGRAMRSLVSLVPAGAPVSLLSTIAGDLAFLLFSVDDFAAFSLAPPPRLTAILPTDVLQVLTGWDKAELEPIGLAAAGEGVTICFPHRYLTLGPLFRIAPDTIRDIHGQAGGPEKLQLSAVADGGGDLILLSEREGKVARVNPRLGTRREVDAPGLPALGAAMLDADTLAVLSGARGKSGISVFSLSTARRWAMPVSASYVSAFSRDREGNLWVWDAGERRIRILTAAGREVYSIRPLFRASTMQLPQQLDVCDDGSFLLGGSGEIWKFENSGLPVWRLSRIPGRPGEQLPSSFSLAGNGDGGSFTLLDAPSRRLLVFAAGPAADGPLASLLSRLDRRNTAELEEAAALARGEGLSLMAWHFGDLLARRGGPEIDRALARIAILKEKSQLYAELADSLVRDLQYDRAENAFLQAGESARELAAEAPDDPAARLVESVISRRQEVRAALSRRSDVHIISTAARVERSTACTRTLVVTLRVQNEGREVLRNVAVHLSMPSVSPAPSLAIIDLLSSQGQRDLEVRLGLLDAFPSASSDTEGLPAGVLITYQKGVEQISVPAAVKATIVDTRPPRESADSLLCRADPGDRLMAGLGDDLLSGEPYALSSLAGILDSLGSLRSRAEPAPGAVDDEAEHVPVRAAFGLRATMRSLSPDERDWSLFIISCAASLGIPTGLVASTDRAFALVDTGIALSDALASTPGLARFTGVLTALSHNGRLCAPLSGRPPPVAGAGGLTPPSAAAWAFLDALTALSDQSMGEATLSWLDPAAAASRPQPSVPVPFPLALPAIPSTTSRSALYAKVNRALESSQ